MPRAITGQTTTVGPTSVSEGDFGSRFPWYVDGINRKMSQRWNKSEVDPRTPKGTRAFLIFTIHRDGTIQPMSAGRRSPAAAPPSIVPACAAAQRVDTFGKLPAGYNSSTLKVSYYCEY